MRRDNEKNGFAGTVAFAWWLSRKYFTYWSLYERAPLIPHSPNDFQWKNRFCCLDHVKHRLHKNQHTCAANTGTRTKENEVKRSETNELRKGKKVSRDLTQRRDRSMCGQVCLWWHICMLRRIWIRLRSRYNFSTGWIISPDISFTWDRSKFSLGSYELWTPHSEASKFSYG